MFIEEWLINLALPITIEIVNYFAHKYSISGTKIPPKVARSVLKIYKKAYKKTKKAYGKDDTKAFSNVTVLDAVAKHFFYWHDDSQLLHDIENACDKICDQNQIESQIKFFTKEIDNFAKKDTVLNDYYGRRKMMNELRGIGNKIFNIREDFLSNHDFTTFLESLPEKRAVSNSLCYDAHSVTFVGRSTELSQLVDFCNCNRKLSWWAITGVAGSGKSRLAFEFISSINNTIHLSPTLNGSWLMKRMKWSVFKNRHFNYSSWRYDKNVLIVIDYVHAEEDGISKWIEELEQSSCGFKSKFRILLIERSSLKIDTNTGTIEYPNWINNLKKGFSDSQTIWSLCHEKEFIQLLHLGEDAMRQIISDYCLSIGSKEIPESDLDVLIRQLKLIDPPLSRPLYGLCYADAWIKYRDISNWDRRDVLEYLNERETTRVRSIFSIKHGENVNGFEAYAFLVTVATIVESLDWQKDKALILDILQYDWKRDLYSNFTEHEIWQMFYCPELLGTDNCLYSLEPDLLGEFFVLEHFKKAKTKDSIEKIISALIDSKEIETKRFVSRLVGDYASELSTLGLLDMLKNLNRNTFTVIDDEGIEIECEVLFTFESDETHKNYIAYTDHTTDSAGNVQVYASIYDPDRDDGTLSPIESEQEWTIIESILESLKEEKYSS